MKRDDLSARVLPIDNSLGVAALWLVAHRLVSRCAGAITMAALLIAGAQTQAWADGQHDGQSADAPQVRTIRVRSTTACGEISYDTQGGSLVINRSYEVQPVVQDLAEDLFAKASEGPFNACLVGDWRGNDADKFFQARGWGLE